jgi:hypothetical protein
MSYPNALDAFVNKIDNFDDVRAADINELQNAIMATQQYFGTQIQFGWLPLPACTYVSATSFTLEGDWTSFLKLGTKFRCTNTTLKYGYILSSSYSSGTGLTTVNLVANTSYALASAAITGAYISYANPPDHPVALDFSGVSGWNPQGFASFGWTPFARFSMIGRLVSFSCAVDGTSNSASLTFKLPVPTGDMLLLQVYATDAGAVVMGLLDAVGAQATAVTVYKGGYGVGWTPSGNKGVRATIQYIAS